ncbi:MAG: 4Fe-4S dicluster domain-containing protein [candidate division WOR-3 bacterium]
MRQVAFSDTNWRQWLARLLEKWAVFFPAEVEGSVHWLRMQPAALSRSGISPAPAFREIRAAEPVKSFFFAPAEKVATFPDKLEPAAGEKRVLLGVKGCDLAALKVHDTMFATGEFADPFFRQRRENSVLIAADCPVPADSCFCNLVGGRPYAAEGADLSLAVIDGTYLVEVLSEAGEELLQTGSDLFQPANEGLVQKRNEERRNAERRLAEANPKPLREDLPAALATRDRDAKFWADAAADCVECSGCLMGCPTCYCFLLYDKVRESGTERTRVWDACYLAAYQRVGGGANARAEFRKRFVNRFHCKFQHFKNAHGFYACSGCGRCFLTCMGKIDIRKILAAV